MNSFFVIFLFESCVGKLQGVTETTYRCDMYKIELKVFYQPDSDLLAVQFEPAKGVFSIESREFCKSGELACGKLGALMW